MNQNLRIPNQKRAIYQVVVSGEGEEKEWENKAKGDDSGHLEAEADEDTRVGSRFLDHQEIRFSVLLGCSCNLLYPLLGSFGLLV